MTKGNLRKNLFWIMVPEGQESIHYGEVEAASGKTLKDHIFNHGHKAEREGENTSPFLFSSCSRCELSGFTLLNMFIQRDLALFVRVQSIQPLELRWVR